MRKRGYVDTNFLRINVLNSGGRTYRKKQIAQKDPTHRHTQSSKSDMIHQYHEFMIAKQLTTLKKSIYN